MLTRLARGFLTLCLFSPAVDARTKTKALDPKDAIDVASHIAISGGPVTRLITTRHYSQTYLYAEHASSQTITIIDLTDRSHPQVISTVAGTGTLISAAGDAALVSSELPTATPGMALTTRTISILDLSDKQNPKVQREFKGVTTVATDDARGLVFLADADGIWVLHRNPASDPEVEKRYAHEVLYNH